MKNKLRELIYRQRKVNTLYRKIYKILNRRAEKKIRKRRDLRIFDLLELSKPLSIYPFEYLADNELYGSAYWMKKYCGYTKPINAYIEHGLFLGSLVKRDEIICFPNNIVTFSDYRSDFISKRVEKNIIKVGPYIHYSEYYLSKDKFYNLKEKLGKVLLVFPTKSFKSIIKHYDFDELIREINRIKHDYDTVLINLYWKDILEGRAEIFRNQGFEVVTAGHINDPYFLSRLKQIISLSDSTMSNKVGTHLGYCIYLNKPHYIFDQEVTRTSPDKKYFRKEENNRKYEEKTSLETDSAFLSSIFSNYNESYISAEQKNVIDRFWGVSYIRSRESMFEILNSLK